MNAHLERASRLAVVVLVVFLLALLVASVQRNLELQEENRRTLATLTQTNRGIVDKLTQVFIEANAAEEARIIDSLKGFVDPALVQKAVEAARAAAIKGATGATGKAGPAGPPGPAAPTTTTAPQPVTHGPDPYPPGASTTTTAAPPTSTTSTSTTTTTRTCTIRLLGLCL